MPILLPVSELAEDMKLAEPFSQNGRVMITAGRRLHENDIHLLNQKYPMASVLVGDPLLERAAGFENDSRERSVANKIHKMIAETMSKTASKLSRRTSLGGRDFMALEDAAMDLMLYLTDNPVTAALLIRTMNQGGYLADHTGAVFYLAMVLGSAVQSYIAGAHMNRTGCRTMPTQATMDLRPLGLGAMFMDLGMYALSDLYDQPDTELTPEYRQQILDHPIAGADMLPQSFPATARMVVRTHHENLCGTGYPAKVHGDKLHIFARIIRLCDYYAAATCPTAERIAKSPARAIWELQHGPARHCYDPLLVNMFARLIQPFPIGAKLKLSNGQYGVLVRYNRKDVFDPTIIIAFDEHSQRLPDEQIVPPFNLKNSPELRIIGFAGEDLNYLYGPDDNSLPPEPDNFTCASDSMIP